jgi:hypothetical protein
MRPLDDEPTLRTFFAKVHLDGATVETLVAEFPDLLAGVGSRLASHALCLAREAALGALADRGRAEIECLAMVYLVGLQSLTMDEFQGAS